MFNVNVMAELFIAFQSCRFVDMSLTLTTLEMLTKKFIFH